MLFRKKEKVKRLKRSKKKKKRRRVEQDPKVPARSKKIEVVCCLSYSGARSSKTNLPKNTSRFAST
jgi:hypothetical protein